MTKNIDVINIIEEYAPLNLAEDWDHPGLAFGSYYSEVRRILLALDLTPQIVQKAIEQDIDLLIVHHPPLFKAIHSLTDANPEGKMQLDLIANDISCYSAHTNLDRTKGGIAAGLARKLQLGISQAGYQLLQPMEDQPDFGYGLYASLEKQLSLFEISRLVSKRLSIPACQHFTSTDNKVEKIALFPGSFDESSIDRLEEIKADVLITGEIKHHAALMLEAREVHVLAVGHDVSERDGMLLLGERLHKAFPELMIEVNQGIDYN